MKYGFKRPATMQDVLDAILADNNLPRKRRRAAKTYFKAYAKARGKPLDAVPSDPAAHRAFIKKFHPVKAGFSKGHWQNAVSIVNFALLHVGLTTLPCRSTAPMSPVWQALYDRLLDRGHRAALSRLIRYCSLRGFLPGNVDDDVLREFSRVLEEESLVKEPYRPYRLSILAWNRAVDEVEGWPQHSLTVPDNKFRWTREWDEFPQTLLEEIDLFLDAGANADRFDERGPRRALAAETIRGHRYQLQCFCSALVITGTPPEELTNLWVLVQPETVKRGLNYLLDHYTTEKTVYRTAQLARTIARDHLCLGDEQVKELTRLCRCINPEPPGMTDKNRERLRPFNDPKNVRMLLDLPARLLRKAKRLDQGRRNDAILVQLALAIEILLVAPLRRRNLAGLSLESHIQWSRAGQDGVVHLVIEAAEVKNRQALEFALPRESRELLKLYIEQYRPRLTTPGNPWLFPGRGDDHKVPAVLGKQITDIIFKETGLSIHLHLFRHIAAKLFLDNNAGQYEVIRRVLGHQNMQTTVNFYAGAEGLTAARHFDSVILNIRDTARNALTDDDDDK